MAVDSRRLTSPGDTRPGAAAVIALLYCLALLAWAAGNLQLSGHRDAAAAVAGDTARTLFLVQGLALSFLVPELVVRRGARASLAVVGLLVLVPLPFLTVIWLAGGLPGTVLLLAQTAVALLAGILALPANAIHRLSEGCRTSLRAMEQVLAAVLVWVYYATIAGRLGL